MANHVRAIRATGCLVAAAVFATANSLLAQAPKPAPQVKSVASAPLASFNGRENYFAYCAVCHGQEGKGNGPAAPAMKATVPDLTRIAQRNKGQFDAVTVEQIIRGSGKTATPAHGVSEMPIWGDVFQLEDRSRQMLRINNLVQYLRSIQATGPQ